MDQQQRNQELSQKSFSELQELLNSVGAGIKMAWRVCPTGFRDNETRLRWDYRLVEEIVRNPHLQHSLSFNLCLYFDSMKHPIYYWQLARLSTFWSAIRL
jgi:hypothetical protein